MNWLLRTFSTSVGKKQIMGVTGLIFCLFLATHLVGNLTIYGGKRFFLSYVEHLHAWGYLVTAAEWGLLLFALLHVGVGLLLFYENFRARPVRYAVKKSAGGRTIGSATAPYSGILILIFLVVHLLMFRLVDKTVLDDFIILTRTFAQWGYVLFYIAGVVIVAFHVSHGFWSGFQTVGLNHPKYMPLIRQLSTAFGLVIGAGFGFIPIFVSWIM